MTTHDVDRNCPRCSSSLTPYPEGQVEVDFCSRCQGIWTDNEELEALVGEAIDPAVLPLPFAGETAAGPPCPACRDAGLSPRHTLSGEPIEILDCFRCRGVWLDGGTLPKLRQLLRRRASSRPRLRPPAPRSRKQPSPGPQPFEQRLGFNVPLVNAVALPAAFALALLLNLTGAQVLLYPFQILVHELGHAVTAWLSGRLAVPLPMGVTFWSDPLLLVVLVMLGLLGSAAYLSFKERRYCALGLSVGLILLQLFLSFGVTEETSEMWAIFGGIGGELLLSAFVVVAFYYPAPDRLRWDFWRYVFLIPAACAFTLQALLWYRVGQDLSLMPLGSALAGTRDGSGDLEKLIGIWGWSKPQISSVYQGIAFVSGLLIAGHYFYFLASGLISAGYRRAKATPSRHAAG